MVLDVSFEHSGDYENISELQTYLSSPEDLYKEFHTNMSQFREPPPYPGPPKQTNVSGLRQSFSGSEASTDVSVSSNENLASCHRQEPQGEETQVPQNCLPFDSNTDSSYSILARLGMPTSGIELTTSTPQIYVTGNTGHSSHGPHFAMSPASMASQRLGTGPNFYVSSESGFSSASTSSSKLTVLDHSSPASPYSMLGSDRSPSVSSKQSLSNFSSPTSVTSYNSNTLYANYPPWNPLSAMDPSQLTNVSQFNAQPTGQMLPQYLSSLPPPPEYPGAHHHHHHHHHQDLEGPEVARRSYELIGRTDFPGSRSQPDLTHFWEGHKSQSMLATGGSGSDRGSQHSIENFPEPRLTDTSIDHIAAQATRMVEVLTDENKSLRERLALYDRKVSKLQKFEMEIQKVNEGYEALVKSSKKREYLELVMKKRYEEEIKNIKAINTSLIRQLESAGISVSEQVILASIDPVDSSMASLLAKHKELLNLKERQDSEVEALRSTVQEQRAQIEILRSMQNSTRLNEEAQRQQIIAEYDEEIQKELASIKAVYEKKEQTEKNIREKLEKEVQYCRQHHTQGTLGKKVEVKKDINADIKRILDEKEAKILQLEKELIAWKEQHLEESIRKLKLQEAESADSTPRLPAYDTPPSSSLSTETLINEAKVEKLKQVEEIYQANKRMAEMEAMVKSLQSQISEKDAMLRVYQRSPMTRSSSVHTIYCTPHHSPRPSLTATGSLSRQSSQDAQALFDIKHKKTGSTSALETFNKSSQDDLFEKIQGLQSQSKSTSDTEESSSAIWQV